MTKKLLFVVITLSLLMISGCFSGVPQSDSGVQKATVNIQTGADGLTVEQKNVQTRLLEDNRVGSIKHLYIISAYSGQVILYSTVNGKVTSSGKRLTPYTVGTYNSMDGNYINIGDKTFETPEVLQDDGTYGNSVEYLYWWDSRGIYHQHYVSGGQIVHISSEPINVKDVIINLEIQ